MANAPVIRIASTVLLTALVAGLLAAAPSDAPQVKSEDRGRQPTVGTGGGVTQNPGNVPATPSDGWKKKPADEIDLPVDGRTGKPLWNGRLLVKFRDNLKVRADRGPGKLAVSSDTRVMPVVEATLNSVNGTIRQALNRSPEELRALEVRAQTKSGVPQPDLASMMYVDVPPGNLLSAARKFNDLDTIEWIEIEMDPIPTGGNQNQSPQFGCGDNGAGNDTGETNCYTAALSVVGRCSQIAGGPGCNNIGACNADPIGVECSYGCNNNACCDIVSAILPGCSAGDDVRGWDALCATYANILCQGTMYTGAPPTAGGQTAPLQLYRFDPCFAMRGPVDITAGVVVIQGEIIDLATAGAGGLGIAPNVSMQLMTYELDEDGKVIVESLAFVAYPTQQAEGSAAVAAQAQADPSLEGAYVALSAGCFAPHEFGGCSQTSCCVFVCRNDPACCSVGWDSTCVTQAQTAAALPSDSPCTPSRLPAPVFDPADPVSPLMTSGLNATGATRGYQAYTSGPPVVGPGDVLPAGVGSSAYAVAPPSVRNDNNNTANRSQTDTNLGTLQFLLGGYRGGGYDLAGFESLAESLGISGALVRGNGVSVAVIEHAAYVNHEDLVNRTIPEPFQTQVLIVQDPIDPNHGTAVLGVIGAEANDFGVTGIAPKCQLRFYPTVSREEGSRLLNALANAIIQMNDGDIMNMSIGYGVDDEGNQLTIPSQPGPYNLISVGTSVGITSIVSAGNDAAPVVTVPENAPDAPEDSGAIIVGACWPGYQNGLLTPTASNPGPYPGFAYCRLNFSSFTNTEAERGGVVHMSGWGTAVTTTGYGDLFAGLNASDDPLQTNRLRAYTAQFNGTSSAAPMVSGLAARVQSFSKRYFGVPLPPLSLRFALENNGYQQCFIDYANPFFPGYPEDGSPAAGDLIPIDLGGVLASIGPFPDALSTIANTVSSTFGGSPVTSDVITGLLLGGNQFSLRQLDGTYLVVDAVRRRAGTFGNGYGPALLYPMTGGTTDVQVTLQSIQNPDNVNTLAVVTASAVSTSVPVIELIYIYNRVENRWTSLGWNMLTTAVPGATAWPVYGDPRNFVIASGNGTVVHARVYTCALGPSGYTVYHDMLAIVIISGVLTPGGGFDP